MLNMVKNVINNITHRPATRINAREPFAEARGRLTIEIEKCIFCGMCQRRCPAGALKVDRAGKDWQLDPYACIICGYCVDACPKKCLHLANAWRVSATGKVTELEHQQPTPAPDIKPDQKVANNN